MTFVDKEIEWEIKRHMIGCYPEEGCGILLDGKFVPLRNEAANPLLDFEIDHNYMLDVFESGANFQALLHSHTNGKDWPTAADMRAQITTDVPWGIVAVGEGGSTSPLVWFGDQLPIQPYEMRKFRWNVHDCFELVRDWYRKEHGIHIAQVPREDEWWEDKIDSRTGEVYWKGQNLIIEQMPLLGFVELPRDGLRPDDLRPGDILTSPLATPVESHCAIYIGDNLVLHHPARSLSGFEPLSYRGWDHATRIYRWKKWR